MKIIYILYISVMIDIEWDVFFYLPIITYNYLCNPHQVDVLYGIQLWWHSSYIVRTACNHKVAGLSLNTAATMLFQCIGETKTVLKQILSKDHYRYEMLK